MNDIGEALRESEQRYRTLFEQVPLGVFLYDRALRITTCNPKFVQILESTPAKLVGLDLRTLRYRAILPAIERVLDGVASSYEGTYEATTSAARIWISMRLSPLRDAKGDVVGGLGVVEDVTERVRALAALRTSEQRLSLHVRLSPLGVIGWTVDHRIAEWNPSATRIFGHAAEQAIGSDGFLLLAGEADRVELEGAFEALLRGTGGERVTTHAVTKEGRRILCEWYNTSLVDQESRVIGAASLVEDVTERRAAEEALKRSEARFRELIERAPDAIGVVRDGRWIYVNPALVSYLGYASGADLIGGPFGDFVVPEQRHALAARFDAQREGHPLVPEEYGLVRRDGVLVTAEVVSMVVDYDGAPALLFFARDVTERKLMHARLLQADRMVSVGTLAAGVAHEINNPLAYLIANLEGVARRLVPLSERLRASEPAEGGAPMSASLSEVRDMIDIARDGADRVRAIVRDLKTFSRADDERLELVDVRRVLDASVNVAWNEIRHRARLVKEYAEVPLVEANESRLGQVFVNLLVNAAQALPVGSAVEHVIVVRVMLEGGRIVVEVSDTGPGIAAEVRDRIFDPFFTTKPVGVGTGLGLWICQGIIAAMGGQISVQSEPGRGATFRISLEIPERLRPAEVDSPAALPKPERSRVLVIDDEAALANALCASLADEHDVVIARSGREALQLLFGGMEFDLILCDLMMPDVTGMDVYERLVAEKPELARRMVFVTGGAFTGRARDFLDSVPNIKLEKPFDLARLQDTVGRALASFAAG